jgi:hypothetical protein
LVALLRRNPNGRSSSHFRFLPTIWQDKTEGHGGEECSGCAKHNSVKRVLIFAYKNVPLGIKGLRELREEFQMLASPLLNAARSEPVCPVSLTNSGAWLGHNE